MDGFLLLLFILNEYFFQRIFPKLLIIFFSFWSMASGECRGVGRNRTGGGRCRGAFSGNTREKGMNFLITFFLINESFSTGDWSRFPHGLLLMEN